MEIIAGWLHAAFPIDDASRIGEARRHGAGLARAMAWGELDIGRLAIVITELASNLLRHAHKGRLLLAARTEAREVEVLAIDSGPGIANLAQCMGDGFSSSSTPGTGLGAVRRLAHAFDIHSSVPHGTAAVSRLRPHGAPAPRPVHEGNMEISAVALAAPGETACGDAWAGCVDGNKAAVMLADGLGHGPDAAQAAHAATSVFVQEPFGDLRANLEQAHRELRTTRGAAVTSIQLDGEQGWMRSAGAGNVSLRVVSGDSDKSVLSQHGTIGVQIRRLEEVRTPWPAHAVVVLHTDGIETRWAPQLIHPILAHDPVLIAAVLARDHLRGHDDATVVVVRRRG